MSRVQNAMLACAVVLGTGGGAMADAADLKAQLDELQRELDVLRAGQDSWLSEARAEEIRTVVTDALADAGSRASLRSADGTAGYHDGFFLSSSDGAFSLRMNVLQQIRWSFNDNEVDSGGGGGGGGVAGLGGGGGGGAGGGQSYGFENKRTRLGFSGNMVDSTWTYDIKYYLGYSNSVEDFGAGELSDASVTKALECGATMTVVQFKLPFSAEYALDAGQLQFMDYSTVDSVYRAGYGQGIKVGYASGDIRFAAAYVNSTNQVNADWDASSPSDEWAIAGRVEAKFAGVWSQFDQAQSWRGDSYGVRLGAGVAIDRVNGGSDATLSRYTVDMTVALGGATVTAAYYATSIDDSGDPALDDANPMGFVLSGAMFVSDTCDVGIRYEYSDIDLDFGGAEQFSALTVGSNWYISRNRAKLGVDFGYAFDAVSFLYEGAASSNNWLLDGSGEDGQWVLRTQLSFSF